MLVQIDGSLHRWLDEDGPQFTLLLAVDDATSAVANAVFSPEEDTRGYFILMRGLIERWGLPIALYSDRHGVFKFSGKPRRPPVEATHFSREWAPRSSPAQGVERAAGTFQDRLVTTASRRRRTCWPIVSGTHHVPPICRIPPVARMDESSAQQGSGQHGQVPVAHPACCSRERPSYAGVQVSPRTHRWPPPSTP